MSHSLGDQLIWSGLSRGSCVPLIPHSPPGSSGLTWAMSFFTVMAKVQSGNGKHGRYLGSGLAHLDFRSIGQSTSCGWPHGHRAGKKSCPFQRWNNRVLWEKVQIQGRVRNCSDTGSRRGDGKNRRRRLAPPETQRPLPAVAVSAVSGKLQWPVCGLGGTVPRRPPRVGAMAPEAGGELGLWLTTSFPVCFSLDWFPAHFSFSFFFFYKSKCQTLNRLTCLFNFWFRALEALSAYGFLVLLWKWLYLGLMFCGYTLGSVT